MFTIPHFRKLNFLLVVLLFIAGCKNQPISPDGGGTPQPGEIFSCADCDYIVELHETNGTDLNFKGGDIVCLKTGEVYDNLLFTEIVGEPDNPIIIRNCDGTAVINSTGSFGVKFKESKYFKFLGDGGGDSEYGIVITTGNSFYLSMEYFTTDFEIANVEIKGATTGGLGTNPGFAGIGVKTSPYVACDVFTDPTRTAWIMNNVSIHDNYVHDTGGEGMYIGHGFYTGRKETDCPSITYSHSIQHLRVYNNIVERSGYDGLQIKNADKDVEIYNNVIKDYGQRNEPAHNEGLFIGEGVTGKIYNNIVMNGTGNGMQFQGMGNNDIYNNIFYGAGENGLFAAYGNYVYRIPDGYFNIMNNTVVNSAGIGYVFYNDEGGVKRFINNIVAGAGGELHPNGATVEESNNIIIANPADVGFVDFVNGDLQLTAGSSAVDAGADVSQYIDLKTDVLGTSRPQGSAVDIGALEFKSN